MKKNISLIVLFILTACGTKPVPTVPPEPTIISVPTIFATIVMPSTPTQVTVPTVVPTNTPIVDTSLAESNERFSPIDDMPQVFIPVGKFRMGGMDARSAPDERPAHYV